MSEATQSTEENYRLSWEYIDSRRPGIWQSVTKSGRGPEIEDQAAQLKQWAETGEEPIRNVTFEEIKERRWIINVCPECGEQSRAPWCCSGCRIKDPASPTGSRCTPCEPIEVAPIPEADQ